MSRTYIGILLAAAHIANRLSRVNRDAGANFDTR
jgi:hypothetical protein